MFRTIINDVCFRFFFAMAHTFAHSDLFYIDIRPTNPFLTVMHALKSSKELYLGIFVLNFQFNIL